MYVQVDRLMLLLDYLSDALNESKEQKNVTVEQVLKAEDINLAENAQLNIQQNQYVVIHQADKWIEEAKQIINDISRYIPNGKDISLPKAVHRFKVTAIKKALEIEHGIKFKAAKRLGIERRALRYIEKIVPDAQS